jgi:hypothetical protein
MVALLGLHFNHTFDLTAIGTVLLALATFVSLLVARRALKQTQDEIELSRAEVEQAHRPVVIPIVDHQRMELGQLGTMERGPRVADGNVLIVPVENIGAGPALRLEARATPIDASGAPSPAPDGPQTPAEIAGLGKGSFAPLEIGVHRLAIGVSFELTVTYEDVADKRWETRGRWSAERSRYVDVRIAPLP